MCQCLINSLTNSQMQGLPEYVECLKRDANPRGRQSKLEPVDTQHGFVHLSIHICVYVCVYLVITVTCAVLSQWEH